MKDIILFEYISWSTIYYSITIGKSTCDYKCHSMKKWENCNVIQSIYWYVLSTNQYILYCTISYTYIQVQDCVYAYERCISVYIRVRTRTYRYTTKYTHMNAVYLGTSPYIRVWIIFAKICMVQDSNHQNLIPLRHERWYFWSPPYDISKTDWDLRMHVTCWLAGCRTSGRSQRKPTCWHGFEAGFQD